MKPTLASPSAVASLFFFGSGFSEPLLDDGSAPDLCLPLRPTPKGRLVRSSAVVGRLEEGESGIHSYAFTGVCGQALHLRLASQAFRGLLHVIGPGGQRWNRPAPTGGAEALEPIILPEDGAYRVLVTSIDNLSYRAPVSHGDYVLEVLGQAS